MNRREFLSWVGVGGVASYLPVALAACSSENSESKSSANPVRADGFQLVGTVAELDQKGEILNREFAGGAVLVIRNPNNSNTITAVNPSCTHAGCTVTWKTAQKEFVCPCHESKFAIDGKVVQGPAKEPLATYAAKLEGDSVLVKAS